MSPGAVTVASSASDETPATNNTSEPQGVKKGQESRVHTCGTCFRSFNRREHRIRHERCHTNDKPYECTICHRRYARQDLVARHEAIIHGQVRKAHKGARRREKGGNFQVTDDAPHEVLVDNAQDIIVDMSHVEDVQDTQNRASIQASTEKEDQSRTQRLSPKNIVQDSLKPAEVEALPAVTGPADGSIGGDLLPNHQSLSWSMPRGVETSHWNGEVQYSETNEGAVSSTQRGPVEYDATDMLTGLFDATQDPYLFHPEWFPNLQPQINIDEAVFMPHEDWPPHEHISLASPVPALPEPIVPQTSAGPRENLPVIVERRQNNPIAQFAPQDLRAAILNDLRIYVSAEELAEIQFPSNRAIQRSIRSYIKSFHCHLPVLHITQILGNDTPSPLRLAIITIGALYLLDRKTASLCLKLVVKTMRLIFTDNFQSHASQHTLWALQCKFLLAFVNAFDGGPSEIQGAMADIAFLQMEFRMRIGVLGPTIEVPEKTSWQTWRNREASKRFLFGVLILGSLMSIAFNLSPGITLTPDIDLELPQDERLWEASSEREWHTVVESIDNSSRVPGLKAAWKFLAFGRGPDVFGAEFSSWSSFSTLAVVHVMISHLWYLMQTTLYCTTFALDTGLDQKMKILSDISTLTALGRCYKVLTSGKSESERSNDDPEGPMIFNCVALLRVGYVRTSIAAITLNQIVLLTDDEKTRSEAIRSYVGSQTPRTSFVPAAVQRIFQALCLPLQAGHIITKKTAAFTWSIEHAISGWDCALYFTKWLHVIEVQTSGVPLNPQEQEIIDNVRNILLDVGEDWDERRPMAPEICRLWAGLYDETWVWEITRRMGFLLRELGSAYESHGVL